MKPRLGVPLVLALAGSLSCSRGAPRSPTAPETTVPQPPPAQQETSPAWGNWVADMVFVSVTGPADNCMVEDRQREIGGGWRNEPLTVELEHPRFRLSYICGDIEFCEYSGTLDGHEFFAAGEASQGTWDLCARPFAYRLSSDIRGQFTDDFRSLSAIERWIYDVDDGQIVVSLEWSARAR